MYCTDIGEKSITHYGRANLLLDYIPDKLNPPAVFGHNLTLAKNYNAKYPLADTLTNYTMANIFGQGLICHIDYIREMNLC